jgi:epoxyqueuosine reductase
MQDWIFGCDICQDVCPVNRKARPSATGLNTERTEIFFDSSALSPSSAVNKDPGLLDLVELLEMSEEQFRQRFRGTPLMRAKREGMQRNACVALGNLGHPAAVPALARALAEASPLVRRHAAWALGQIGSADAKATLNAARETEQAAEVSEEIRDALIAVR